MITGNYNNHPSHVKNRHGSFDTIDPSIYPRACESRVFYYIQGGQESVLALPAPRSCMCESDSSLSLCKASIPSPEELRHGDPSLDMLEELRHYTIPATEERVPSLAVLPTHLAVLVPFYLCFAFPSSLPEPPSPTLLLLLLLLRPLLLLNPISSFHAEGFLS